MSRVRLAAILSAAVMVAGPLGAAGVDTWKARCVMCHAADGNGSSMGKKLGARPLGSPEVQKQSDAALAGTIAKGRGKMPAYGSKMSPAEIQAVVRHVRTFAKKGD